MVFLMSRNKHLGRKSLSVLLAVLMVLTSVYAGLGVVASAAFSDLPGLGDTLAANTVYKVTGNYEVAASNSTNGLKGPASGTAVIYIAEGATLTVKGSNASGTTAGKAGILMQGGTLIITGKGTLVVKGGNGGNGIGGTKGGDASNQSGGNGTGGAGGAGGAGGGAGIGGNGGSGGSANGGAAGTGGAFSGTLVIASGLLSDSNKQNGTNGTAGTDNTTNGNDGSYKDSGCNGAKHTTKGGGGGGGGGLGGGGAAIGAGGNGGKGGAKGSDGTTDGSTAADGAHGTNGSVGTGYTPGSDLANTLNDLYDFYTTKLPAVVDGDTTLAPEQEAWKYNTSQLANCYTADELLAMKATAKGTDNVLYNYITNASNQTIVETFTDTTFKTKYLEYVDTNLDNAIKMQLIKEGVTTLINNGANDKAYGSMTAEEKKAERDAILAANFADGVYNKQAISDFWTVINKAYNDIIDIEGYEGLLVTMTAEMGAPYNAFSLANAEALVAIYKEAMDKADLMNAKVALDAEYNKYFAKLENPSVSTDEIADEVLDNLPEKVGGFISTINLYKTESFFSEVFTDAEYTEKTTDFVNRINFAIDRRDREETYQNGYYAYFSNDRIFANYAEWSNAKITQRYSEDSAQLPNLVNKYNEDVAAFKAKYLERGLEDAAAAEAAEALAAEIYTLRYNGTDMLLQEAVEIYLENLKSNIIARNNYQLDKIAEYAKDSDGNFTTTVTMDNFMGIRGALMAVDSELLEYCKNKNWVDSNRLTIANSMGTLQDNYNNFVANPPTPTKVDRDDGNGYYTTRYAGDKKIDGEQVGFPNDIARSTDNKNYDVTEAKILAVIDKLEEFLKGDELSFLMGDGTNAAELEKLPDFLMRMVADKLFTDQVASTIVGMLYPSLVSAFVDLRTTVVDLASSYSPEIYSAHDLASSLGLGVYPDQVAAKITDTRFNTAKNRISSAGQNWDSLKNAEGKFDIDWGINAISAEGKTASQYYDAKLTRFVSAVAEGLRAIQPVVLSLLAEKEYNKSDSKLGTVKPFITRQDLKADIVFYGTPGYSILVAPLLEMLDPRNEHTNLVLSRDSAKNLSNNEAILEAIFNPITDFLKNRMGNKPVNTLLDVLPNLIYALTFNRLQFLLDKLVLNIHYEGKVGGLVGFLASLFANLKGDYNISIGEKVSVDSFSIPLNDLNALLSGIVGGLFNQGGDDEESSFSLPIINGGKIMQSATPVKPYTTKRVTSGDFNVGSRLSLQTDKADAFYVVLAWLVRNIKDDTFMDNLISAFGGSKGSPIVKALIANQDGDEDTRTKAALAALVELFCPQEYDLMKYNWVNHDDIDYNINGVSPADIPYLAYGNNWTRQKAGDILATLDDTLDVILDLAGLGGTTVNELLAGLLGKVFSNGVITGMVKALVGLGAGMAPKTVAILQRYLQIDMTTWSDTFGYLFPEIYAEKNAALEAGADPIPDPLAPGDEGYQNKIPTVTGVKVADATEDEDAKYEWTITKDGNAVTLVDGEEGSRQTFIDLFCAVGAGFAPIVETLLTGTDYDLLNGLVTVLGYDTYENSFEPLFKALGIEIKINEGNENEYKLNADGFKRFIAEQNAEGKDGAVEAFNKLANGIFAWLNDLITANGGKVLTNVMNVLPNLVYFLESGGLTASLHNLMMPILVLLDVARPIADLDLDKILSTLLTRLINKATDDMDILDVLLGQDDFTPDQTQVQINVKIRELTLSGIIQLLDGIFHTDFYHSPLVTYAIPAMCLNRYEYELTNEGETEPYFTGYKVNVDPRDALSILLGGFIEGMRYETTVEAEGHALNGQTLPNRDIVAKFLIDQTGSDAIPKFYDKLVGLFSGEAADQIPINWNFMDASLELNQEFTLPAQTSDMVNAYLSYGNDWTRTLADYVANNIDGIADVLVKKFKGSDASIAVILQGLVNSKFYSDDVLNAIIELLVGLISDLDPKLVTLLGILLDIDITAWYDYCDQDPETGKLIKYKKYDKENNDIVVATDGKGKVHANKVWNITDRASFVRSFKEAASKLDRLILWLFHGKDYALGHTTDLAAVEDAYNAMNPLASNFDPQDLLVLKGGEGYKLGLVPILEALGAKPEKVEDIFKVTVGEGEDAHDEVVIESAAPAVDSFLNTLCNTIDGITGTTGDPGKVLGNLIDLLPNLLYFINADGLMASVTNLVAPLQKLINTIMGTEGSILGYYTPGGNKEEAADEPDQPGDPDEPIVDPDEPGDDPEEPVDDGTFALTDLTTDNILTLIADLTGLTFSTVEKDGIKNFYLGKVNYDNNSASGMDRFYLTYTEDETVVDEETGEETVIHGENRKDMITILVSLVVDMLKYNVLEGDNDEVVYKNAKALDSLLNTNGLLEKAIGILYGLDVNYETINWNYYVAPANDGVNTAGITEGDFTSTDDIEYLKYPNDWTEETAEYLDANLDKIVDSILKKFDKDNLNDILAGISLYNDGTVNAILNVIRTALNGLKNNIDENIIPLVAQVLGIDAGYFNNLMNSTTPYEGVKEHDKDSFLTALFGNGEEGGQLTPFSRVFSFLLLGEDYKYLTSAEEGNDDLIVISGSLGYKKGLIPILEALGVTPPDPARYYDAETGKYDGNGLMREVVDAVFTKLETFTEFKYLNEMDEGEDSIIKQGLAMIPELLYFINADGLKIGVKNILAALFTMVDTLNDVGIEGLNIDLSRLTDLIDKLDIEGIAGLIKDATSQKDDEDNAIEGTGIEIPAEIVEYVKVKRIGSIAAYASASGDPAYKVTYTKTSDEAAREERSDLITCIVSAVLETALYGNNLDNLARLLGEKGEQIIGAVQGVLTQLTSGSIEYAEPDWDYNEGMAKTTTYIEYPNDWTEDVAKYLDTNLVALGNMIAATMKDAEDQPYTSLGDLLADKVDGKVFNNDMAKKLAEALQSLAGTIEGKLKEAVGEDTAAVILNIIGVDLTTLVDPDSVAGVHDVDTFITAVQTILKPFKSVLEYLLLNEGYAFFVYAGDTDDYNPGDDIIKVKGGEGYARGILPLLEELGVKDLPKDYASIDAMVEGLIKAVDARANTILADPINEIFALLPTLIYYVNAGGLTVAANNTIAALKSLYENVLTAIGKGDEANLDALLGFTLSDISFDTIFALVDKNTAFELNQPLGTYLSAFNFGDKVEKDSANEVTKYTTIKYTADEDRHDMLTIVASLALETLKHKNNAKELDKLLKGNTVETILDILENPTAPTYSFDYKWNYAEENRYPKSTTYIGYPNNWTEATAIYVEEHLDEIGTLLAKAVDENNTSVGDLLKDVNLYSDKTVNTIAGLLKNVLATTLPNALKDKLGEDKADMVLNLAYKVLRIDPTPILEYNTDGSHNVTDKASFIREMKALLAPLNKALGVLLLADEYDYLVYAGNAEGTEDKQDIIRIAGGEGYRNGIAPVLEILGCTNVPASYANVDAMLTGVLGNVCDRIDAILADPLNEVINLLPTLIYFVNANGLGVAADNLIAPVNSLYAKLRAAITSLPELNISPISVGFTQIFGAVETATDPNLVLNESIGDYVTKFNFGTKEALPTVSDAETLYKIKTNAEDTRYDVLTIVASLALQVIDDNDATIKALLNNNNVYQVIHNILNLKLLPGAPVRDIAWKYTEKANTNEVIQPLDTSAVFKPYGPLFTRDKAQYMADNFQAFIDNMIQLLGIEGKDGQFINSLEDLLNNVVGNSLYTTGNLEKIYGKISGAVNEIKTALGDNYNMLVEVLAKAEIATLADYNDYEVETITEGDRDAFANEIVRMLKPLYGVLKWLLTNSDLAFFTDKTDNRPAGEVNGDQIVLPGAEGYKYGIVPILEALCCTKVEGGQAVGIDGIKTQEQYEADVEADEDNLIKDILNPVFDKLDTVLADPANELFNLIPNVQYFINCGALDTCVRNVLNAVYTLIDAIKPLKEINLDQLIDEKLPLKDLTMSSIFHALVSNLGTISIDLAGTTIDLNLNDMDIELLLQCFNGYLYSYTNTKSGQSPAYYMGYAGQASKADTLAVILQMLLKWIASGDNPAKLKQIVRAKIEMSDEGYAYIDKLIDLVAAYAGTPSGMDSLLHMIYYTFYGIHNGTAPVAEWQRSYNDRLQLISKSAEATKTDENLGNVADLLDWLFQTYVEGEDADDDERAPTGDVYHYQDSDRTENGKDSKNGFAKNGFIRFFQQIIEWIKKIITFSWLKNLTK